MNELQELRILVDCAIDGAVVRRPHSRRCGCPVCVRRRGWEVRLDHIASGEPLEADPFFVRRVVPLIGPLPPGVQRRPLAIGDRMPINTGTGLRQLRSQLWTKPGVFLSGATERQARRWAMRQARPLGGRVTAVDQHPSGRPQFHIELPLGAPRSGHIFYGTAPAGSFFEFDDL